MNCILSSASSVVYYLSVCLRINFPESLGLLQPARQVVKHYARHHSLLLACVWVKRNSWRITGFISRLNLILIRIWIMSIDRSILFSVWIISPSRKINVRRDECRTRTNQVHSVYGQYQRFPGTCALGSVGEKWTTLLNASRVVIFYALYSELSEGKNFWI